MNYFKIIIFSLLFTLISCNSNINKNYLGKYIHNYNNDEIYMEILLFKNKDKYAGEIIGFYNGEDHGIFRYFAQLENIQIIKDKISFTAKNRILSIEKIHFNGNKRLKTLPKDYGGIGDLDFNGKITGDKIILSWKSEDEFEEDNDVIFKKEK